MPDAEETADLSVGIDPKVPLVTRHEKNSKDIRFGADQSVQVTSADRKNFGPTDSPFGPETKKSKHMHMKKLLMMTALSCVFAAQTLPAFADATTAQKTQIEQARAAVGEAMKTDEGCKAMCEEMMKHKSSKKMMYEMMAKDPEAMKMMKGM